MKKLLPVLLLMVMLLCGGCWDWQILDDLSIIFGIGVDRAETEPGDDAEMFLFSFVNPVFDPDADEVRVVTAITGYSLRQSLFNLQLQSDQQPVLSKVNVMIFCEEAARDGGMHDIMLQMDQLRESNPDSWICIVRDATARQVLSLEVPQQPRPAVFLADVLNHNHANGRIPLVNAFRYWAEYNTPGVNPVVPVIELTGPPGEEPDGILLAGLAAIDDQGRMKGCLSDTETINYLLLTNGMRRGRFYTRVDYAGQKRLVTAFIQKNTLNITTSIVRDRPVVDIKAEIVLDSVNVDL